jgi:predicted NAD/FAD-dependent oxidoreductase
VSRLAANRAGWEVADNGRPLKADALILTVPAPSALALIGANGVPLCEAAWKVLEGIRYDPCIALMALLDGPGEVPDPGGVQIGDDPLFWLADNRRKGISPEPAVTIHAGPEFSREHAGSSDADVVRLLLREAKDYLGTGVKATAVYRWEYSWVAEAYDEPYVFSEGPPPLVLCGDAYGGPKVEGAVLSGLAAAERLLEIR